jgi:hypothetical protein
MKIFTDDLEYGITGSRDFYGLGTKKEPVEADSLLWSYILKNFMVSVNGEPVNYIYVGKEVELDVTWIYIEIGDISGFGNIEITNKMLTELFRDQVNIVNVNYNGETLGLLLKKDNPSGVLKFYQP